MSIQEGRLMKLKLDRDEWYPVFSLGEYGREVEISEEFWKHYQKICLEFDDLQYELAEIWNEAKTPS